MDVEAWWRSGDGGWDVLERRFAAASEAWLPAEMERCGLLGGAVEGEVKPVSWWRNGFWEGF